jgi:hypothetical protein
MWGRRFEPYVLENVWHMDMVPQKYRDFWHVFTQKSLPIYVKQWTSELR